MSVHPAGCEESPLIAAMNEAPAACGGEAPADAAPDLAEVFRRRRYTIRRNMFRLFGGAFQILDDAGCMVGFGRQAFMKRKTDIQVWTDTGCKTGLLSIKDRTVAEFGAVYDVIDPAEGRTVGSMRRRKLWGSPMLVDDWLVFDAAGFEVGKLSEASAGMTAIRLFLGRLMQVVSPESYVLEVGPVRVATMSTRRNPLVYKLDVDMIPSVRQHVDPRVVLAGGILLAAVDGFLSPFDAPLFT